MRAVRWRVYFNPLNAAGTAYTGWVEVTDDVELTSLGTLDQQIDNTDYNIGIYRTSNFQITLRNDSGRYSDVGNPVSMFVFTRSNTLVKITFTASSVPMICGFFKSSGIKLASEITVFTGLLDDSAVSIDVDTKELQFDVLGLENLFSQASVPIAAISSLATPVTSIPAASPGVITGHLPGGIFPNPNFFPNFNPSRPFGIPIRFVPDPTSTLPTELNAGQTYYVCGVSFVSNTFNVASSYADAIAGKAINFSSGGVIGLAISCLAMQGVSVQNIIISILQQAAIETILDIDPTMIQPGNNFIPWDTSDLASLTVWDALQEVLLLSNSVLYIDQTNLKVIVTSRAVGPTLAYTFRGQSSPYGNENIQDIQGLKNGLARVFNTLVWTPANTQIQEPVSAAQYGVRQKSFNYSVFYDAFSQGLIMIPIVVEFAYPKQEMDIYVPVSYATLALTLLNQVAVDYPPVPLGGPNGVFICGEAICGEAFLGYFDYTFYEVPSIVYKVEGTSIDPTTDLICISVRRA